MEKFDNVYSYLLFIYLVLPGYVIIRAKNFISGASERKSFELVLSCVFFSAWNFVLCISIIQGCLDETVNIAIGSILTVLVVPLIQGILLGIMERNNVFYWMAKKIGLMNERKLGTVWDASFDNEHKQWLRVIVDNKIYEGKTHSVSLYDDKSKEIFLTDVKVFDGDGAVIRDLTSAKGVLINATDVKVVELFE